MAKVGPTTSADAELAVELSEADFILKHIPYRRCIQRVQNPDKEKDQFCQCGHKLDEQHSHAVEGVLPSEVKWSVEEHTQAVHQADSFGTMQFSSTHKTAKYVRVDSRLTEGDNMRYLSDLILNYWGLSVPNLIITVTGGALSFNMSRQITQKFRQGIVRAAQSTGAWIVTGGTFAGVMKHTGKAVRDCAIQGAHTNDIVCIGVAPWGVVEGRDVLVRQAPQAGTKAQYMVPKVPKGNHPDAKKIYLDPNHTHFILVDNGTHGKFATEIKLRAALEQYVSNMSPSADKSVKVPVCCVVLQGGPGSLTTVHEAVKLGTPVVIVKDSGKIADVLAAGYLQSSAEHLDGKEITVMDDQVRNNLRNMLRKETNDEKKVEEWLAKVEECLRVRDLITVYSIDSDDITSDFDLAILLSLFKAQKGDVKTQLKLSLAWNRVDMAEHHLFTDERNWSRNAFDEAAYSAFVHNRTEFLQLFLQNGFNLKNFLGIAELARLYNDIPKLSLLRRLLTDASAGDVDFNENKQLLSLYHVGRLMNNIFGDLAGYPYCDDDRYNWIDTGRLLHFSESVFGDNARHRKESKMQRAVSKTSLGSLVAETRFGGPGVNGDTFVVTKPLHEKVNPSRRNLSEEKERAMYEEVLDRTKTRRLTASMKNSHDSSSIPHFDDPAFDLFVYCILLNRPDMAMICFEEVREAIPAALTAVQIYKTMAKKVDDNEAQEEFDKQADRFESVAYDVLSECFEAAPEAAQVLLIRKVTLLNGRTSLAIAQSADAIRFISHPCCQVLFNRLWLGKIDEEYSFPSLALIGLSCVCPPFLYLLNYDKVVKKKKKVIVKKAEAEVQSAAPTEVTSSTAQLVPPERKEKRQKSFSLLQHPFIMKAMLFFNAPVVIFVYSIFMYLCFLILLSYDILIQYPSYGVAWSSNWVEVVLVIYVASLFCEQIRASLTSADSGSVLYSLYQNFTYFWNQMELVAVVFFTLAMILGNSGIANASAVNAGRVFYSLSVLAFFAKILSWYSINQSLGPKIVMIGGLLMDLMNFMGILLVIILGWGIAEYSLLFPKAPAQWTLMRDVLVLPYMQMLGQFYFNVIRQKPYDVPDEGSCTDDPELYSDYSMIRCSDSIGQTFVPILLVIYIAFVNLLLLNLLTATFAYTVSAVQGEANQHWSYQRYRLIAKFVSKPPLVPPFVLFSHLYMLIKATVCWATGSKYKSMDVNFSIRVRLNERDDFKKRSWMCSQKDDYMRKNREAAEETVENHVRNMNEKMAELVNTMESLTFVPAGANAVVKHKPSRRPAAGSAEQIKLCKELLEMNNSLSDTKNMLEKVLNWAETTHASGYESPVHLAGPSWIRKGSVRHDVAAHKSARSPAYPTLNVQRFAVPNNKVPWKAKFKHYQPTTCSASSDFLRQQYLSCDPDILLVSPRRRVFQFNRYDNVSECDRTSTEFIEVHDGIPLNPGGRTGVIGRGLLPRWGPNQTLLCAVLRHKLHHDGDTHRHLEVNNRPVLELLLLRDSVTSEFTIPYAFFEACDSNLLQKMMSKLKDAAAANHSLSDEQRTQMGKRIEQIFEQQKNPAYSGYFDCALNTDNAWLEAHCVGLFLPDEVGQAVLATEEQICWTELSPLNELAVENGILRRIFRKIAEQFDGHF